MSELKENITQMAEQIKGNIKPGEAGVFDVDPETFEKTLEGTDVTMDMVEKVHAHRDNFAAASALAFGEVSCDEFKANKDLNQTSVGFKIGHDHMDHTFYRNKQVPDGNKGTKTAHGILNTKYRANGVANKGSLKKVKASLAARASELAAG